MYILKNAWKCISRAKGRSILIGVIVLVISVSACLGLSIRQAAESAREETLAGMSVTATISFDRQSMMSGMAKPEEGGGFDRGEFSEMFSEMSSLTLEDYQVYAEAESVQDFYYSMSASLNGSDDFLPVSSDYTEEDEQENKNDFSEMGMGGIGMPGGGFEMIRGAQSDFSLVGYSGENAMADFQSGTASVSTGTIFEEGTEALECIISEELAAYNDVSVGDTIVLTNPNNEEETYELTVIGFYTDSSANENSFSMMGATSTDPANRIYLSYAALKTVTDASAENAETQTDENTGREYSTEIAGTVEATYVLADADAYTAFEEEVRTLGLDEDYTVSSQDITAYENSLVPLETLSTMAGYFLIVILVIGAIILIVLNLFSVRERKYEIGVLTAMGMKKWKVAVQFLTEIFVITMAAVIIGIGTGAVCSVPVTNALLEGQVSSQNTRFEQIEQNFGRGEMPGNAEIPDMPDVGAGDRGDFGDIGNMFGNLFGGGENSYVTEIGSAMNFTVVLQMLGIAVLLTLTAGMASMLFIMRYEPLKILANRD